MFESITEGTWNQRVINEVRSGLDFRESKKMTESK